jgi:hypothetical protein
MENEKESLMSLSMTPSVAVVARALSICPFVHRHVVNDSLYIS